MLSSETNGCTKYQKNNNGHLSIIIKIVLAINTAIIITVVKGYQRNSGNIKDTAGMHTTNEEAVDGSLAKMSTIETQNFILQWH